MSLRPDLAIIAANATVAKPARIELHFSEKLMPAFSKADLTMAAMPGMAAMKMASASALSSGRIEQKLPSQPRAVASFRNASMPFAIFSAVVPGGSAGSDVSTASGLIPTSNTRGFDMHPF